MPGKNLIIVPTYNEAENLRPLVQRLLALKSPVSVLVIDDNSPDGTGKIAEELAGENPGRVFVKHRSGKLGLGTAHRDGFRWAMTNGYDRVVTMDADFSHPPEVIPEMLSRLESAGIVIGSRYVPGGRTEGWPLKRKINSWTANFLARLFMGLKAKDCTGAFRAYRVEWLQKIPLEKMRARGYSAHLEVLFYLEKAGARVEEVPIVFTERKRGRSKISFREIREALGIIFFYLFQRFRC